MQIHYDEQEKVFKKKYFMWTISIVLVGTTVEFFIFKHYSNSYFNWVYFFNFIVFTPMFMNYLFLKMLKCPNCQRPYFTPFFADKDDIKNLIKSNPKCINCDFEAVIISDYKTMY